LKGKLGLVGLVVFSALAAAQTGGAVLERYCAYCHNEKLKTGGLDLTKLNVSHPGGAAQEWEKVVRKLRAGMMPPAGMPRPDRATINAFAASLESGLDQAAAARPNPGRPALHRLNRVEYANSVHDLLGLDIDVAALLPADDMSHGFDNMAEVLNLSPTLMEGYIRAAGKISRAAVGDPGISPLVETYHIPQAFSQTRHVEGTPFGTRGGIAVRHNFPADGEYSFKMTFYYSSIGPMFGASQKGEQIEIAVNGERAALMDINPNLKVSDDVRTPRIKVKAGPQWISAAFIKRSSGPVEDFVMPFEGALDDLSTGHIPGLTGLPHLRDLGINGPYNTTGVGDTPSRRRIFVCRPSDAADELPCAKKIIAPLARQAFRRPVSAADLESLLSLYQAGRNRGDFDSGIRMAVQAIVADPEFVFRFERPPAGVTPGTNYRIGDLELASRLSYFLWSSAPDGELLSKAAEGRLADPKVLEQQVRRMLADSRSEALAQNFAGQWLFLRNLKDVQPDVYVYPDFDMNLLQSMRRETELFFDSFRREDRNVAEMLTASDTFVDERLAKHYGIPDIHGSYFRRVNLPADSPRRGLLGQGSILTVTSVATRTSPVTRGRWILENLLGTPAPIPPPGVDTNLEKNPEEVKNTSLRARLEAHRKNPTCASCHKIMDPIGFALENFDLVGTWRDVDGRMPVDASGQLVDGTILKSPADLRAALLSRSDAFATNATEKLFTYALGRPVQYFDMPTVRAVVHRAAQNDYRFSSLILGVVSSDPFQMRMKKPTVASGN
jgi:cytochrome c551/c552